MLSRVCWFQTESCRQDGGWSWLGGKGLYENIWQLTQGAGAVLRGDTSGPKRSSL